MKATHNADKCLHPECDKTRNVRGLCAGHYQYACRLVRDGKTTWEELEKHGKCTTARHRNIWKKTWLMDFKQPKKGQY